jgi:hypothetical protein
MKCQSFPYFAAVFALTFAWGPISLHAADEAALDTANLSNKLCAGLLVNARKSIAWQVHGLWFIVYDALYRWLKFCRGEKHLWFPPASKPVAAS